MAEVPLPYPWGVLYRHPNPDGTRKRCDNCIMWLRKDADGRPKCVIHPRSLEVPASFICGFHVFGQYPMDKWVDHPNMDPVQPELSGLRQAGAGLVCANCRYFRQVKPGKGWCLAVAKVRNAEPPQPVAAMGWCARHDSI